MNEVCSEKLNANLCVFVFEPVNFYTGSKYGCPKNNSLEDPPYVPHLHDSLGARTLCMTAKQANTTHYNLHSLFGWSECRASTVALTKTRGIKFFILFLALVIFRKKIYDYCKINFSKLRTLCWTLDW